MGFRRAYTADKPLLAGVKCCNIVLSLSVAIFADEMKNRMLGMAG